MFKSSRLVVCFTGNYSECSTCWNIQVQARIWLKRWLCPLVYLALMSGKSGDISTRLWITLNTMVVLVMLHRCRRVSRLSSVSMFVTLFGQSYSWFRVLFSATMDDGIGSRCYLEQETLFSLLSIDWFQERIRVWFQNRTIVNGWPYGRLTFMPNKNPRLIPPKP